MKRLSLQYQHYLIGKLSKKQVNSLVNFVNRNVTTTSNNNSGIIGINRMFSTNFKSLARMFENEQEQQAYEREKERLFTEAQQQPNPNNEWSESNTNTSTESKNPSFMVTALVFGAIWYGIKYVLEKAKDSIKQNEYFEWLSKGNFNVNELSEMDEHRVVSLLTDIK